MDIDRLFAIAKDGNPETLEAERDRLFEEFIQTIPPDKQLKLRQLQFKLKNLRYKYKDPLVCASKMYGMMLDSLNELNETIKPFKK